MTMMRIKKCVIKQKLEFEDYKHCLEATQLENEKNQLDKNKLDVNSVRENHKELTNHKLKNYKLILKSE